MTTLNEIDYDQTEGNISLPSRIFRAITALFMLIYPMIEGLPIDLVALFPLIAIYPMYTAIVGWDPVAFILASARAQGKYSQIRVAARVFLFIIGAALIGYTLVIAELSSKVLGNNSILALVGILPIYVAIIAENPIVALRDSIAAVLNNSEVETKQSLAINTDPKIMNNISDVQDELSDMAKQPIQHQQAA